MSVPNTPPAMMFAASQPLFTVAQWQELEHQALIFKYLKAGLTVPPDLLVPIQKSLELMMSQQKHPSLGYYRNGKKIDPEPGRCRRTDGKKWRCSKVAHPDSKYCDRHMIRRRCRSRKLVESESQSSSVATTGTTSTVSAATGTFQNLPLHTNGTRQGFTIGNGNSNNSTMNMMEPLPLPTEVSSKELRFGLSSDTEEHNFFQKDLGPMRHQGYDFTLDTSEDTWSLMSQIPRHLISESRSRSTMANNCFHQQTMRDAELLNLYNVGRSKELVFNGQLSSPGCLKQEYQPPQSLFSDSHLKMDLSSSAIDYRPIIDFNCNSDAN
ncbi:hypothetical protein TanjilG_20618 [Lupinus angustifolius]|uniref:Growth-regulating factor n=1 Tax=Lupinus angustifolius TaxID=3871 RepID=A0A4P1QRD9_LUPAN|nr:PREDICTED: growth-regulating factor 5-like [Lupinus angustifolius]XP_019424244.1 PREDICTED: growth-regulating factor 5-like [Lupinus angustifolius]OIV92956.1 hypothetical protein TanjilG_20618 [Lupinus angustifolius]